ncbi:hypothetical protein CBF17_001770 [Pantoea agglomerans]|nr:hypothetical protein CBF17_001770 [Pantoea agglomerans]
MNPVRREHGQKRKASRAMDKIKTSGAFLNNAKRWPGYGRTSGMRCVIAWAERVTDDGFCVFPI